MKSSALGIMLIVVALLLIYLGITGNLGKFLAAIFNPSEVTVG